MRILKKLIIVGILVTPWTLSAEGLGIYVPFSLSSHSTVGTNNVKADYDPSLGLVSCMTQMWVKTSFSTIV